ncbi:MAG: DUF5125 domain-containing protein, partial [Prevotellaceae bacterium]|nr:DUF5125 domain-containing protein [Prevotellaceae bacterium]
MKKLLQSLAIVMLLFTGCNEEDPLTRELTRPDDGMHLTATPIDQLTLDENNGDKTALTFTWDRAVDRGEGTSVSYRFQLSVQERSATWEPDDNSVLQQCSISFTHDELNTLITKTLGAMPGDPAILEAKVVAEVIAAKYMLPEVSNTSIVVTPYGEKMNINGYPFIQMGDNENLFSVDLDIVRNETLTVGVLDFSDWWIDPDFFEKTGDQTLRFIPITGRYRIIANFERKYFKVQVMNSNNELATLQEDGSGAVWAIGEGLGNPTIANLIGWSPSDAICLAPMGNGIYKLSGIGGQRFKTNQLGIKFQPRHDSWDAIERPDTGNETTPKYGTINNDFILVDGGDNVHLK